MKQIEKFKLNGNAILNADINHFYSISLKLSLVCKF